MCDLCDENAVVKSAAKLEARRQANQFRKMVKLYDGLASGAIDPHGKDIQEYKPIARMLLEELVVWI